MLRRVVTLSLTRFTVGDALLPDQQCAELSRMVLTLELFPRVVDLLLITRFTGRQ